MALTNQITKNSKHFFLKSLALLVLVCAITGCANTAQILKPAPKEGVSVKGINLLFISIPFKVKDNPSSDIQVTHNPDPIKERLRDEVGQKVPPQFKKKGIATNFASVDVTPGVAASSIKELFPKDSLDMHLLTITPLSSKVQCNGGSCSTSYTISVSLRTPNENKELWNLQLQQGELKLADWISSGNDSLINDIVKNVLMVVHP